jgi:hypothetical protein
MKRDMDLIRQILFKMEASSEPAVMGAEWLNIDGYTIDQVGYCLDLMVDGNLLRVVFGSSYAISWQGYEFLEAARDQKRWAHFRKICSEAGGLTFDVCTDILKDMGKQIAIKLILSQVS